MRNVSSLALVALACATIATVVAGAHTRAPDPIGMSVSPTKPPLDAGLDGGAPLPPIPDGGPIKADAAQPMHVDRP
jgi:hypothetical protein